MSHPTSGHHADDHKHTRAECAEFEGPDVWYGSLVIILALLTYFFVFLIMELLLGIENSWFTIGVTMLVLRFMVPLVTTSPSAFVAELLLNQINGRMRVVFSGLQFILPWERIEEPIDQKADITANIPMILSTKDGEVKGTLSIRAKPDLGTPSDLPRVRSEHAIRYASNTEAAIAEMIEATCLDRVRAHVNDKTTDEAVLIDDIRTELDDKLDYIEKQLSIDILECVLKDLDYSDETKKSKNSEFKGSTLRKMISDLMDPKFGYTKQEAKDIVLVTMDGVRQSKDVKEFNLAGIPPILEKFLEEFLTKYFDKSSKTSE
jgi:hypothetical protein